MGTGVTKLMKKFKLLSRWAAVNSIFAIAVYMAVFKEHEPSENVITWVVWFFAVSALTLFSDNVVKAVFSKDSATFTVLPRWVDFTYDCMIISMLLYPGWFWTASVYTFYMIMQQYGYDRWKELKEKKDEKADSGGGSPRTVRNSGGNTSQN
jgi:hypothetical protein